MITIQKATANDAQLITDIGIKTFHESHGHSGPAADIDSYVSNTYNLKVLQDELSNAGNLFHIIYYNNQPAGFSKIILNTPHPLIKTDDVTKLEKIYLLKEFYDLKLGLKLFQFIVNFSKEENQTGIWLNTWIKNERAVSFYKRNGFEIIGNKDFKISATHSNPNYVMYLKY